MQVLKAGKPTDPSWYGACVFCNSIHVASAMDLKDYVKVDRNAGHVKMTAVISCEVCRIDNSVCYHPESSEGGQALKKQVQRSELASA